MSTEIGGARQMRIFSRLKVSSDRNLSIIIFYIADAVANPPKLIPGSQEELKHA